MPNIINENILRREIRRIVREEIKKEFPKNQLDSLWKYLNQINEKLKVLESKWIK